MKKQAGVTLIELLVVIATVGMLVVLIANLPPSIGLIGRSSHQSLANQIANKQIETIRSTPYANLADGTTTISDSRLSSLPSETGTVAISDCDPNICKNGEVMKQVTVSITWKEAGKGQQLIFNTLVTEGGLK